jgi:cell division septation protein DedD
MFGDRMDPALKHRLIGAAVLSALAVIFLPKLIVSHDTSSTAADVSLKMPNAPNGDFQTRELPLVTPAAGVPQGGVVGMDASHPAAPAPASSSALPDAGAQPAPSASTSGTAAAVIGSPAAGAAAAATLPTASTPSAPATAAPSAPIPAASAGGRYVVSLGTYSNAANAQSLVASLKAVQLPAYAETMTVAGKPVTRARIGPYTQRGDAEAARLKAQQVRTDMPASVTALDAAAAAPDAAAAPGKPTPPATAPAVKPTAPASATVSKPSAPTAASATKPAATAAAPATAAAKPAAPSPAAAGRGFVVQLVAFRSQDEALTLRDKLRAAGFTAFSERIQADSGALYRVRVGPEADRDAADRLRAEVSAKLGLSGIVVAYP